MATRQNDELRRERGDDDLMTTGSERSMTTGGRQSMTRSNSPFALMSRMAEEMDRMFENFGFSGAGARMSGSGWMPQIEVTEQDDRYVVRADLPGMRKEDVHIDVADDVLMIEGERREERATGGSGSFRHTERRYGRFHRAVPLPQGVDPDQVRARFENGVLEISMPLPETARRRRPRRIEIG